MNSTTNIMTIPKVVLQGWRPGDRRAVTLLEVLLAMTLLVLLTSMTYWFYAATLRTREEDTQVARKQQLARVIMLRLSMEIRQASQITTNGRVGIRGEAEHIWLSSLRVPSRELSKDPSVLLEPPSSEFDLVKIEYSIARHPEILHEDGYEEALGLARVEHRIPRPDSADQEDVFPSRQFFGDDGSSNGNDNSAADDAAVEQEWERLLEEEADGPQIGIEDEINWEELYSKEIRFLRFCYYDGYNWWDDWDVVGENPLPQLVQVTIGFESRPPFDAEFGVEEEDADEFCTCMNKDPSDCLPLPPDQYTMTVRIPQADPFFRSRVTKETQALVKQVVGEETP